MHTERPSAFPSGRTPGGGGPFRGADARRRRADRRVHHPGPGVPARRPARRQPGERRLRVRPHLRLQRRRPGPAARLRLPRDALVAARRRLPDLVLTASENVDVPEGTCPVLVLPHGIGFQKYVPDSRADRVRLSGLVPDALLEAGRAWLATSHPDQDEQLLAAHPKAAGRTLLVGDPCFDELAASAALRPAHRAALGVGDDRRLVVVSSTWGPTSLLGERPDLRRDSLPRCRTTRTAWRRSCTPTSGRRTAPGSSGGTSPPRSTRACCSFRRRTRGARCCSPRTWSSGTTGR